MCTINVLVITSFNYLDVAVSIGSVYMTHGKIIMDFVSKRSLNSERRKQYNA